MLELLQAKETITINSPSCLFFTSDPHFFHQKIVEFTGRPTTIEEHNNWLVNQYNSKIPQNAFVFCLGDMFFKSTNEEAVEILFNLNGNWTFILGNHDNPSKMLTVVNTVNSMKGTSHKVVGWYYRLLVRIEPPVKGEKVYKKQCILSHFPIEDWEAVSYGSLMLHGHVHGAKETHEGMLLSSPKNRLDVGIDNNPNFEPFSFQDVLNILS